MVFGVHINERYKKRGQTPFNVGCTQCKQDAAHEKFNAFQFKWKINNHILQNKTIKNALCALQFRGWLMQTDCTEILSTASIYAGEFQIELD